MIKQKITCDVQANTVKRELVEDNTPVWVDYQCEIDECKQRLAQTDYVIIKIAEGIALREQYAHVLVERQALRERIAVLEQAQKEQMT